MRRAARRIVTLLATFCVSSAGLFDRRGAVNKAAHRVPSMYKNFFTSIFLYVRANTARIHARYIQASRASEYRQSGTTKLIDEINSLLIFKRRVAFVEIWKISYANFNRKRRKKRDFYRSPRVLLRKWTVMKRKLMMFCLRVQRGFTQFDLFTSPDVNRARWFIHDFAVIVYDQWFIPMEWFR